MRARGATSSQARFSESHLSRPASEQPAGGGVRGTSGLRGVASALPMARFPSPQMRKPFLGHVTT